MKSPIHTLLNALDYSLNANSAWLHFDINTTQQFDFGTFLKTQLKTGYFHFTLVQNDIERGWENYIQMTFPYNQKEGYILLQRPGTTWNGNEIITTNQITEDSAKQRILALLLLERATATLAPEEEQLRQNKTIHLVDSFINFIQTPEDVELSFYNILPDFLWSVKGSLENTNDLTRLGYFDDFGRDFVLGIIVHNKKTQTSAVKILMTNGHA